MGAADDHPPAHDQQFIQQHASARRPAAMSGRLVTLRVKGVTMRNSPGLPALALIGAAALGVFTVVVHLTGPAKSVFVLTETEIGLVAWALTFAVYGLQGVLLVALEGRELHPGLGKPRLTEPLSVAIVVFALLVLAAAVGLGWGIFSGWGPGSLGLLAGAGCLDLALLLVFYKEAIMGDEVRLEKRADGIPW